MTLKKIMLLFCALCLLSFQQDEIKRIVIVAYREPEVMYGNIKQVIELRPDTVPIGDKPQLVPDDTTLFDRKGDPIRTSLGEKGYRVPGFTTYDTKYDDNQKGKQTIVYGDTKRIFFFEGSGRITKEEEPGPTQPLSYVLYNYNSAGELSSCQEYGYHNELRSRGSFEYDLKGILISWEFHHGNYHSKADYKYLSFDEKGNWTKRIINTDRTADTITRKITYY